MPEQPASRSLVERRLPHAVVGQSGVAETPADDAAAVTPTESAPMVVPPAEGTAPAVEPPAGGIADGGGVDGLSVDRLTVEHMLSPDLAAQAVAGWRAALTSDRGPDSTLAGAVQSGSWLDLTNAHPSGLAQLLAGRPTRLSSLIREAGAHAAARRRARAIRSAATTLATERGVRGCFLAAGVVRWGAGGAAVSAPVLLRGCTLRARGSAAEDFDLHLDDGAVVNAELLRAVGAAHSVSVDGAELSALAFGQRGFDPRPVYDWLESRCGGLPGFRLERSLVVATFTAGTGAVLADLDAAATVIADHDLLSRIAARQALPGDLAAERGDDPQVGSAVVVSAGAAPGLLPGGRERDEEPRPLDLDPAQRVALEGVLSGRSLAIEGPPGTGVTHTLATSAAVLAGMGQRVLVLCPRRATAEAFLGRLQSAGLAELAFDVRDGGSDRVQVVAELVGSLDSALDSVLDLGGQSAAHGSGPAAGPGDGPGTAAAPGAGPEVHRVTQLTGPPPAPPGLLRARDRLAGCSAALHAVRSPWGVSAYQAMVAWAELTGRRHPPRTRVRLAEPVLARLDLPTRERLRTHLHLAAAAGSFTTTAVETRWFDADVNTDAAARQALGAAQAARDGFSEAASRVEVVAATAGLAAPRTVDGWRPLLDLLLDVRETLDVMLPAVYEQPLAELIAATGRARVREVGPTERIRRRRRAAALVRPGMLVEDLNARLVAAAAQRQRWQQLTEGECWPVVPTGLDEAWAAVERVELALASLAEVFGGEQQARLRSTQLDDLGRRLDDLAGDEAGILGQPRRLTLLSGLHDAGLEPLVADLRGRRATDDEVDGELDLAWWGGVLEAIVNGDNRLARHDGRALRAAGDDLAEGDRALIADALRALLAGRAARARQVARAHPDQERFLREQIEADPRAAWPADLFRHAPDLLAALRPIWLMSPDAVARCLPGPGEGSGAGLDAVIVDDAASVGMYEAAATIARAAQVVAGGDRNGLRPPDGAESVLSAVCQVAGVYRLDRDHRTRDGRLLALVRHRYSQEWDAVPGAAAHPQLRFDMVGDGTALPALGEEIAISPDAEVRRVVELVAEHAALRSAESLLVVTLGERHAERIEEALRLATRSRAILARWLDEQSVAGVAEPFLVRSAGKLHGLERDAVILTVGLARTPHGRVIHRFGALDAEGGPGALVAGLSRARLRTTLVACYGSDELLDERLHTEGARMLRTVLRVAEGRQPAISRPAPEPDALVADLKARLEVAGMPVRLGVGDSRWPVDLALSDPQRPRTMLLAVDLDGPRYAARGLRERDRQRREQFERAGWAYLKVSAMDVFSDPGAEVDRIRRAWIRAMLDREREVGLDDGEPRRTASPPKASGLATPPASEASGPAPPSASKAAAPAGSGASEPVLPEQTRDDTDAGWGDRPRDDSGGRASGNDERLLSERPPHWDE